MACWCFKGEVSSEIDSDFTPLAKLKDRQTNTDGQTNTETNGERERETDRHRERERERLPKSYCQCYLSIVTLSAIYIYSMIYMFVELFIHTRACF